MHQIFSLLWQAGVWIFSDPNRTRAFIGLMRLGQQYYNSLSPAQKARVDSIIRWGVVRAVKFTVGDVLGDVAHQVLAEGYGEKVAEFAKAVVVRGVEVGIDKALEEAHGQIPTPHGAMKITDEIDLGEEAAREDAHNLSEFAGSVYDACKEAGYEIQSLEQLFAAYSYGGRVVCLGCDEEGLACYAPTPFKFYSGVPRELEEFLNNRSSSLEYGAWGLPQIDGHYSVMFRVAIEPEAMSNELFRFVTEYASQERAEVEEILLRAGYKPS